MTWVSLSLPNTWPVVTLILALIFLAGYSWPRRNVPGVLPFMIGCILTAMATTGQMMANLVPDPGLRSFWLRFMFAWLMPAAATVTCFILEYAWPGRWLTRRNLAVLFALPVFHIFYFLGGGYVFLGPIEFATGETVTLPLNLTGQVSILYFLILTFINLIVFGWLFIRSPQHRWLVLLMAVSQVSTRFLVFGQHLSLALDVISIPSFTLPYLAYGVALFGFRIFDPIPLARKTAIDQLHVGMIVLDPQQRVISLNPAAEKILNTTSREAYNRPVREWLPVYPENINSTPEENEIEFKQKTGSTQRYFIVTSSWLNDFRGGPVGSLLMLRDITEQKLAQAQILDQQRAMATQKERERMARELHDSLGQVLSYASLQVETASQLSLEGKGQAAAAQLERLGIVVREAHADLREHILNLHNSTPLDQPFFPAVKQYLEGFTRSYDIQTLLAVEPGLEKRDLPANMKLQIFRILQEATSNARKHGHARQVQVCFLAEPGRLGMTIRDDGWGFTPEKSTPSGAAQPGEAHYGLKFMVERAEALDGSLQISSVPGSGTRVELMIPIEEA